nr:CheB methylesterase domain-containing protein [Spirochaetota bacterium]
HMLVKTKGSEKIIKIVDGPKIFNQRPAVDALFDSVANEVGKNSIGILLTGMGRDGAKGLLNIKNSGGFTIAQDRESSIVWGMPKEAIDIGAANKILSLESISPFLKEFNRPKL